MESDQKKYKVILDKQVRKLLKKFHPDRLIKETNKNKKRFDDIYKKIINLQHLIIEPIREKESNQPPPPSPPLRHRDRPTPPPETEEQKQARLKEDRARAEAAAQRLIEEDRARKERLPKRLRRNGTMSNHTNWIERSDGEYSNRSGPQQQIGLWEKNNSFSDCAICGKDFGWRGWQYFAQHHCRKCGQLVCDDCLISDKKVLKKLPEANIPHEIQHNPSGSNPYATGSYIGTKKEKICTRCVKKKDSI